MRLIEQIIGIIAPHVCAGCGREGAVLCTACRAGLPAAINRCYRCHKSIVDGKTCASCRSSTKLTRVRAFTRYEATAKRLVWQLKFERAKAAADELGCMIASLLPDEPDVIVVHVPTAASRVRQRGYDQALLIARIAARKRKLHRAALLIRQNQSQQHGAGRQQRLAQMKDAFRVRHIDMVKGAHIVLVDDVLTTGATLEAAAAALKGAGAKKVEAIVFAQA